MNIINNKSIISIIHHYKNYLKKLKKIKKRLNGAEPMIVYPYTSSIFPNQGFHQFLFD